MIGHHHNPSTNGQTLVEIQRVGKRFADRAVLEDINLSIPRGQTTMLIGPSGGGKSTLLRCINGLAAFDSGTIRVEDHTLHGGNGHDRAAVLRVRRLVGMVFQDFQLFAHLTALENVATGPIEVLRHPPESARAAAQELLVRVGLADRAHHKPHQLSGGQKQRVAIARALAMQPRGLLCDEITSALDPELKQEVLAVLDDLRRDGLTLLMVTHEIGFARRSADHVAFLAGGRVVESGAAGQVLAAPRDVRLQKFLRHLAD